MKLLHILKHYQMYLGKLKEISKNRFRPSLSGFHKVENWKLKIIMSNRFCICDLLDIFRSKYRKRNNTNSFLFRSESEKKIQLCNCSVCQTQPMKGRSSSILDCQLSFWKMAKIRSKRIFSKFLLVFLDISGNALEHVKVSSFCVNPSSRYNCR